MRRIALGLFALTLAASSAMAQTPLTFAEVDTDGNGELSYEELLAVWPDLTQEEFDRADVNMSGGLSPDELNALQPSTLPAPAPEASPPALDGGDMLEPQTLPGS
ncbi:MAG: hypothetical protein ABS75_13830 [Pelagibacterium sp. SCN 63-23]|nr:MAG: hypothetical protein ABS75_13830 [Pelagibacterium sp. SCN 63-23]